MHDSGCRGKCGFGKSVTFASRGSRKATLVVEVNDDDYDVGNLFQKSKTANLKKAIISKKKKEGDIFGTRRDQLVQLHHQSVCKARPGYLGLIPAMLQGLFASMCRPKIRQKAAHGVYIDYFFPFPLSRFKSSDHNESQALDLGFSGDVF